MKNIINTLKNPLVLLLTFIMLFSSICLPNPSFASKTNAKSGWTKVQFEDFEPTAKEGKRLKKFLNSYLKEKYIIYGVCKVLTKIPKTGIVTKPLEKAARKSITWQKKHNKKILARFNEGRRNKKYTLFRYAYREYKVRDQLRGFKCTSAYWR